MLLSYVSRRIYQIARDPECLLEDLEVIRVEEIRADDELDEVAHEGLELVGVADGRMS